MVEYTIRTDRYTLFRLRLMPLILKRGPWKPAMRVFRITNLRRVLEFRSAVAQLRSLRIGV